MKMWYFLYPTLLVMWCRRVRKWSLFSNLVSWKNTHCGRVLPSVTAGMLSEVLNPFKLHVAIMIWSVEPKRDESTGSALGLSGFRRYRGGVGLCELQLVEGQGDLSCHNGS